MTSSALFPLPVQAGDVLRGKYRVERLIGQGGMAYVVSAWHLHLEQRVAIKLLRPETADHPEVLERFLREARASSKLEDVHVARVLDVDRLESGPPFIVMEYLEGADLARLLRERGPLAPHDVAAWVCEACSAIAEAHALGIVHRDLKPANLFLARKRSGEPIVKVLDFGISMLREDTRLTRADVGMGSAEYMSPEQMQSAADVDARSDVWSLGVTMYELTTGKTPFHADGVGQVAIALMTRDPVPPRELRPDLPAALEAVILRCLEKDPARRYASVRDLATALGPLAHAPPKPVHAAGPTLASAATPWAASASTPSAAEPPRAPPAPTAPPAPAPGSPSSPHLALGAGIAIAVLALVLVVIAFLLGRGQGATAGDGSARFRLDAATVYDEQAKLTWQRTPAPGAMDWASARAYCARQGGGFRLPEAHELVGLLAVTATRPPLDPVGFPTTPVDVFWSGSQAGAGAVAVVHFSTGRESTSVISGRNRVRCVRP